MTELAEFGPDGSISLHLHPGQRQAWDSTARFVAVLAGTQGGKTSFAPYWLHREMERRGPGDYLFVTPTFQLLELKALPELVRLFQQRLALGQYVTTPRRMFLVSEAGAVTLFGARYNPDTSPPTRILFGYAGNSESLESATCLAAVCDEAGQTGFKQGAWEAILRRLSLAVGRVLITTSVYTLGWLKEKYDRCNAGDDDWEFIQFDSTLNPAFPREEFERARRDLPRWKFDMLYRGQFSRAAGLVYDCYNPVAHRSPRFAIPRNWPRLIGLDFGKANTAAVLLARDPDSGRLYLYRTYHEGSKSTTGHVRSILSGEPGIGRVVGGAACEDEWRNEWRAAGLPVRRPAVGDVEVGIDRVYGLIARGNLVVFDDLAEFHDEITTYSRVLDDKGAPTAAIQDRHTYHLLDALRYIVSDLQGGLAARRVQGRSIEFYAMT